MEKRRNDSRSEIITRSKSARQRRIVNETMLTESIVFNILSRIPAQFLFGSMRLVCKLWAEMINGPYFMELQLRQSKPGLFLQQKNHPYSARFLAARSENEFEISDLNPQYPGLMFSSSGGMSLFRVPMTESIYVVNPLTLQGAKVPKPTRLLLYRNSFCIAWNPLNKEYKLVCGYEDLNTRAHFCVRTLGIDGEWRKIHTTLPWLGWLMHETPLSIGVFVCWTLKFAHHLVIMDITDESVRVLQVPRGRATPMTYLRMGGYLSAITKNGAVYTIHILKDVHLGLWIIYHKFDFARTTDFLNTVSLKFVAWTAKEQELIMLATRDDYRLNYLAYSIPSQRLRAFDGYINPEENVQIHTNSLVPIKI